MRTHPVRPLCTNGMRCRSSRSERHCRRDASDAAERKPTVRRVEQPSESPLQALWQLAKAVRAELSDPLTPVMALGSAASAILGSPVDAVLVGTVLTGNSILAAAQRLRAEKRLSHLLALQLRRPAR